MEQNGLSDIEGKAAREAASEVGAERVSTQRQRDDLLANAFGVASIFGLSLRPFVASVVKIFLLGFVEIGLIMSSY
jgi:hypothetical protein